MKAISLIALASLLASPALAAFTDEEYDSAGWVAGGVVASAQDLTTIRTLNADGSTKTWSQADLLAALQLMNRKYHRDVETPSGRRAWHGALIREEIDLDAETKTEVYADGATFVFPFKPKSSVWQAAAPASTPTDRIPPALAAARARRRAEAATTNTVTVVTTPK